MRLNVRCFAKILFLLLLACRLQLAFAADQSSSRAKWEKEISTLTAGDRTNPPPRNAILFVGSSSLRLWKTLAADFPGQKVINRGFGGSQISDVIEFTEQIVIPYKPRQILLYGGDNDIAAGESPAQVLVDFKTFVARARSQLPGVRIDFIAIKPSPSRWHLADKVREANRLIEDYTKTERNTGYIDVFTPMLGQDGAPRAELFVSDNLHLNEKGYALWREIIGPRLQK